MGDNGKSNKTKIQIFVEHIDTAREAFIKAAGVALSLAQELESHADDVKAYRDGILGTVASAGGDASFPFDAEIKKYIPEKYRKDNEAGNAGANRES